MPFDALIARLWSKTTKANSVSEAVKQTSDYMPTELYQETKNALISAFQEGYGKQLAISLQDNFTDNIISLRFQQEVMSNISTFAAFKNHSNIAAISSRLFDAEGKRRTFAEFKAEALKISEKYNTNFLRAEYHRANRSGAMAERWQKFVKQKDRYNLQYVAVMDERTRKSHKELNGIIRSVDDPIWDIIMPPDDWGCRCTAKQTQQKPNTASLPLPDDIDSIVPAEFQYNPGNTAPFVNNHPYYNTPYKDKLTKWLQSKDNSYEIITGANDQYLDNPLLAARNHGNSKKERLDNIRIGQKLQQQTFPVELPPTLDKNAINIDAKVNHRYNELKSCTSYNSVQLAIKDCLKQKTKARYGGHDFDVTIEISNIDQQEAVKAVSRQLAKHRQEKRKFVKYLYIITNNNVKIFRFNSL